MAYTTAALVKTYLSVTGTGDDALLTTLAGAAQAWIDAFCSRTFEAAADTTRRYTVGRDTDGRILYLDDDLCQITTVTTDADRSGGGDVIASTDYITYPRNRTPWYMIEILSSSDYRWTYTTNAENGITILGRFAYSTTAPTIIAQAATRLTAYLYRQKDAQVFDVTALPEQGVITIPQGMPADIVKMLTPYQKLGGV